MVLAGYVGAAGKQRQEDREFETNLGCIMRAV